MERIDSAHEISHPRRGQLCPFYNLLKLPVLVVQVASLGRSRGILWVLQSPGWGIVPRHAPGAIDLRSGALDSLLELTRPFAPRLLDEEGAAVVLAEARDVDCPP